MRGAIHLVAILVTALGVGCTTTVDVVFDEREDFSRYRTWDWAPRALPKVDAPHREARALDARVARLIERQLFESGFERAAGRPDFLVTYHLTLRRRAVVALEPMAPDLLASNNSSASYWIEGSRTVRRVHEDVRLAIGLSEARGRRIWRATLLGTWVDTAVLPLDDAVATLLDRFPRPGPWDEADEADPRP